MSIRKQRVGGGFQPPTSRSRVGGINRSAHTRLQYDKENTFRDWTLQTDCCPVMLLVQGDTIRLMTDEKIIDAVSWDG